MQSFKLDMREARGVTFASERYTKGVRGWTSGQSLPVNFVE